MFKLEITTGGAAFCDDVSGDEDVFCEGNEVSRILQVVAEQASWGRRSGSVNDINGNKVCTWRYEDEG